MKKVTTIAYCSLLLLSSFQLFSQTNPRVSATDLNNYPSTTLGLKNALSMIQADNSPITNFVHDGPENSAGTFIWKQDGQMTDGLLLSTGYVTDVDFTASGFASEDNPSTINDADLLQLTSLSTYDVARTSFTCQALGDTFSIRYRFASEEYNAYNCTSIDDDVFGIFIRHIDSTAWKLISLVPGTNEAVGLASIHAAGSASCPASHPEYYVANAGNLQPIYDGYTTWLEAKAAVMAGQKYEVKIVIADVSVSAYDSAIFIDKIGSTSGSRQVLTATYPAREGLLMEGHQPVMLTVRAKAGSTVQYTLLGTAASTDYLVSPAEWVIPNNSDSLLVSVSSKPDNLAEGLEKIGFKVRLAEAVYDTFWLSISDNTYFPALQSTVSVGCGGNIGLDATFAETGQRIYSNDSSLIRNYTLTWMKY